MANTVAIIVLVVFVILILAIIFLRRHIRKKKEKLVIPQEVIQELEQVERRWEIDSKDGTTNPYTTLWTYAKSRANKGTVGTGVSEAISADRPTISRHEAVSSGQLHREPSIRETIQNRTTESDGEEHSSDSKSRRDPSKNFFARFRKS